MIQVESVLFVADNSGAKSVVCIKILGSSKKRYGYIGDIIKVSVKKCTPKSKVKKGGVYNAIIVRTLKGISRKDGSFISFNNNAVVILNDKLDIIGTRILGPVVKELRLLGFLKIISLASEVF